MQHRRVGKLRYIAEYGTFFMLALIWVTALYFRRRYRIISVHSMPDALVFAAVIPRLLGAKVVLDLHESMPEFFTTKFRTGMDHPLARLVSWLEQASIRFADFSITCNEQMRQRFIERGADPKRLGVVMHSADESTFSPEGLWSQQLRSNNFTIISHGTIEERYGLDTAIRAVARLKAELPDLRLEVYGEGPQESELRTLVKELGVADRVWFSGGFVPLKNLLDAIARADTGLVATKRDAFRDLTHCLKMFEFISMRKPVICSRTPAVEAYFDEDSFLYFESNDVEGLAQAILRLYTEPKLGARLISRATETNEQYRWPRQREIFITLMQQVLEQRRC
jgi:glycosyltransferase involved in cell wall biosynthesis